MLSLVQSFVEKYDVEVTEMRDCMKGLKSVTGEQKVMANCMEQKMHYLEREVTKL